MIFFSISIIFSEVSSFLSSSYGGPIVARGIFKEDIWQVNDYYYPTSISEAFFDGAGNQIKMTDSSNSVYSIFDQIY